MILYCIFIVSFFIVKVLITLKLNLVINGSVFIKIFYFTCKIEKLGLDYPKSQWFILFSFQDQYFRIFFKRRKRLIILKCVCCMFAN